MLQESAKFLGSTAFFKPSQLRVPCTICFGGLFWRAFRKALRTVTILLRILPTLWVHSQFVFELWVVARTVGRRPLMELPETCFMPALGCPAGPDLKDVSQTIQRPPCLFGGCLRGAGLHSSWPTFSSSCRPLYLPCLYISTTCCHLGIDQAHCCGQMFSLMPASRLDWVPPRYMHYLRCTSAFT